MRYQITYQDGKSEVIEFDDYKMISKTTAKFFNIGHFITSTYEFTGASVRTNVSKIDALPPIPLTEEEKKDRAKTRRHFLIIDLLAFALVILLIYCTMTHSFPFLP